MRSARLFAIAAILAALSSRWGICQKLEESVSGSRKAITLDSGFVLFEGRYLPRPYTLRLTDQGLLLNDCLLLAAESNTTSPQPEAATTNKLEPPTAPKNAKRLVWRESANSAFFGPGLRRKKRFGNFGPAKSRSTRSSEEQEHGVFVTGRLQADREHFALVEQLLQDDALIIAWQDGNFVSAYAPANLDLLEILVLDAPLDEKLSRIKDLLDEYHVNYQLERWRTVVTHFVVSPQVQEQVMPAIEFRRKIAQQNEKLHNLFLLQQWAATPVVQYVLNVLGMFLVVVAFGTVLNYRPRKNVRWSQRDFSGRGCRLVIRHVSIILLLGLFDFACTVLAGKSSVSFMELNPLAASIVHDPLNLAVFKFGPLTASCTILVLLRRYYGAQIASWWLSLICAILLLRWTAFTAMFLG